MSKIVKFTIEQRSSDISENIWEREINSNQTKELIFEKLLIVFSPTGHYVGRVTSLSKYFAVVEISDDADYTLAEDFVIVPNFIFLKDACSTPILIGFNITPKKDDSGDKNSTKYVSEYYPDKNIKISFYQLIKFDFYHKIGEPNVNGYIIPTDEWEKEISSERISEMLKTRQLLVTDELMTNSNKFTNNAGSIDLANCCGAVINISEDSVLVKIDSSCKYDRDNFYIAPRYMGNPDKDRVVRDIKLLGFDLIEKSKIDSCLEISRAFDEEKVEEQLSFKEAFEALKAGYKIRRSIWAGYWKWENDTIMMHCKNGEILDIRETSDVIFTIGNMLADDWQIIDMDDEEFDLNIKTIRFGEALREAKAGKRITRKAWDYSGKRCVVYQKGYPKGIPCNKQTAKAWGIEEGEIFRCEPYLQIETGYNQEDATHEMYTPTNDDLFAEDWYVEK